MTVKHHSVAPETLGQRPELDHNRYESGSTPLSFDGVGVSFGTPTKPHRYEAPTGDGITSRRLRRFALVLSRFQLANSKQLAKRWKVRQSSLKYAEQIYAIKAYKSAFNDDPTIGTLSTNVLATMLNEPSPNPELIGKALSYAGTTALDSLLSQLNDGDIRDIISESANRIKKIYISEGSWHWREVKGINNPDKYIRRRAKRSYRDLAREIDELSQQGAKQIKDSEIKKTTKPASYDFGKGSAGYSDGTDRWHALFVSKPELPLTHTGKLGRRIMYTDTGRTIKNISRMFSDPEQRIFTRKTRALGAVVIIDCSGSMSLTEGDIDEMITVSAGATVLCYSSGRHPSETDPNAYVVARKGRRVRELPRFNGGNGCDVPALMYGIKQLRESSRQPVIWISDEQVTGTGDCVTEDLQEEAERVKKRYGIIVCSSSRRAIKKLKQLQGKG